MPPNLSEDEIDDLLYYARTGDLQEFTALSSELCKREQSTTPAVLLVAKDHYSGNGTLHMAAANGHAEILTNLIATLSTPTPQNTTQLLLLNGQNEAGNTPLHWAALNGHLKCVKVLIDNGADPTVTNRAGHDPVYEAEVNDRREVVEWVLREGGEGLEEGVGGEGEGEGDGEEIGDEDIGVETQEQGAGVGGEEGIREGLGGLDMKDDKL